MFYLTYSKWHVHSPRHARGEDGAPSLGLTRMTWTATFPQLNHLPSSPNVKMQLL